MEETDRHFNDLLEKVLGRNGVGITYQVLERITKPNAKPADKTR